MYITPAGELDLYYIINPTKTVIQTFQCSKKAHEDTMSSPTAFSKKTNVGNSLNVRYTKNIHYHLLHLLTDVLPSQNMMMGRNLEEHLILLLKMRKLKVNEGR